MLNGFFDLTQPVGLVETWVSIAVVLFMMWLGFIVVKHSKAKESENK